MNTSLKLSNGKSMPVLGLGTWQSPKDQVKNAVKYALKIGYRHIDCAYVYENEEVIGEALAESMKELNLKREDIFITSKCWCTHLRPELVRKCCDKTLKDLRLDYVDLYLVHWPVAMKYGDALFPSVDGGKTVIVENVSLVETWKSMEALVDAGLVKSIGLSNFNSRQITSILNNCRIKPVNLQVEIHANFPNTKLVEFAQSKGLTVAAYSPLGSPGTIPGETNLLESPWLAPIAKKYNKKNSQVLLRYLLQRNLIVLPKSVTPSRIEENAQIFDFTLTDEDMKEINAKGLNKRVITVPMMKPSEEFPFDDEY